MRNHRQRRTYFESFSAGGKRLYDPLPRVNGLWQYLARFISLLMILLAAVHIPLQGQEQAPGTSTTVPSANSETSLKTGLFGATTELENSVGTKGAQLGIAKAPTTGQKRKGEFAFAPIPLLNPSIGNGMGATLLYMRPLDSNRETPPSTFAIGGFGTGNGSWGLGLGTKLYLKNDRYRITAGYGGGIFNYNYYGIGPDAGAAGLAIPFSQRSRSYLIEPTVRTFGKWFVGPRYHHVSNRVSLNQDKLSDGFAGTLPSDLARDLPVPLPSGLDLTTAALGLAVKWDTTDSPFYPRSGSLLQTTLDFFDPAFGAQRNYRGFNIDYNKYFSFGTKNVLATHLSSCLVSTDAPFFDLCLLGNSKDLRGYPIGQYRDGRMLDGQAEFRRELIWRLGAVAFLGLGEVAKAFGDFDGSHLVPGGGIGLRYDLAKRNHLNLRADYAWGKDSHAFYMGIGEAF